MAALREARLLGALIPTSLGGDGACLSDVANATALLSRRCASTAMIFAMHQIQVACLIGHGRSELLQEMIRKVADEQLLLASATTEVGTGGEVGRSVCAVELLDGGIRLQKQAPVISYGAYADGILATARRSVDSPPSDQVLVAALKNDYTLEATSVWDTLGFRGTCSNGFQLGIETDSDGVLSDAYSEISSQTMLPVSHILWSSVWYGIAAEAVGRARSFVQTLARKDPGTTPPAALRLAELYPKLTALRELIDGFIRRYEDLQHDQGAFGSVSTGVAFNGLKVSSSNAVVEIVTEALLIAGIAGYSNSSPYSMGRLLRDALGASLMVNNDRILANTAQMLLVLREG
jgi:acyl-CoA dehydrogenase